MKALCRQSASRRSWNRRKARLRAGRLFLQVWPWLRQRDGASPANALRNRGSTGRFGILDPRPRRGQLCTDRRSFDGEPEGLSRDDILDNITFYWLTNTALSSGRLYWEHRQRRRRASDAKGVTIPVGVSASQIYTAPKSWTERAFPKLLHYGRLPKGCHFAPGNSRSTSDEVRASFKTLRT